MNAGGPAHVAVKRSVAPLVVLLVIELLGLVPWLVISALSGMGFDSGFHWPVVFLMAPFWIYPILMLFCVPIAFSQNRKGRASAATLTMFLPLLISWGWFGLLMIGASSIGKLKW
jgi:hypothetical protein